MPSVGFSINTDTEQLSTKLPIAAISELPTRGGNAATLRQCLSTVMNFRNKIKAGHLPKVTGFHV